MSTAAAIAREYFPEASIDELEFILWERTAYPFAPVDDLRDQLARYADFTYRYPNALPCEFCNNLTVGGSLLCLICKVDLANTPLLNP
jgi:hypothetical protein